MSDEEDEQGTPVQPAEPEFSGIYFFCDFVFFFSIEKNNLNI